MLYRIAIFALLASCGGKTVSVASSAPGETAEPTPAPAPSPNESSPSDPVPDPIPGPTTPSCDVSLARDVMPIFVATSCTLGACHGGANPPNAPRIDVSDDYATRRQLTTFKLSDGSRYVDLASPGRSSIVCNLARSNACGVHMPLGAQLTDAQLATIQDWVACGAPVN